MATNDSPPSDETFRGWTNRETWATAHHIETNRGLYRHRCTLCEEALAAGYDRSATTRLLAWSLQHWIAGLADDARREQESNARLARIIEDVGELTRKHRRHEEALAEEHELPRLTPDRVLAYSLESWVTALSESLYRETESLAHLARMFEDIGDMDRVNWQEIADTFLGTHR